MSKLLKKIKKKKDRELKECCELEPKAMQKLTEKSIDISKLREKEILVAFLFYYSVDIYSNNRTKRNLIKNLQAKISERTAGILSNHVNANASIAVTCANNINTNASTLADIDNFYSDKKVDRNDTTAI